MITLFHNYGVDRALFDIIDMAGPFHTETTSSRNGPVRAFSKPVMSVWHPASSRISIDPTRNANPFFHFMEAIWMLAGRNDLAYVSLFAAVMKQFSDDGGKTQPGAYGYRWRNQIPGVDQLQHLIGHMTHSPETRRAVLSMWDAHADLDSIDSGTDVPCNTHIYFNMSKGNLDMTVCCRSNDVVWGAYGSNIVHFSLLHEVMARVLDKPLGYLYQFSNNMHFYIERPDVKRLFELHVCKREVMQPWDTWGGFIGPDHTAAEVQEVLDRLADWGATERMMAPSSWGSSGLPLLPTAATLESVWHTHKSDGPARALQRLDELKEFVRPAPLYEACARWLGRAEARRQQEAAK